MSLAENESSALYGVPEGNEECAAAFRIAGRVRPPGLTVETERDAGVVLEPVAHNYNLPQRAALRNARLGL